MQEEERAKIIFSKSARDILPNLIFFGLGVPVIIFLGRYLHWLGIVGFIIYASILLIDILRILVAVGSGILLLLPSLHRGENRWLKAQAISLAATFVQIVETGIFGIYTVILYRYFFLP